MEGSTNNTNVANYQLLSKYYDELLSDEEAFSLWLKYIEEKPFKTVLELASGSGILADILAKKGYIVTASDISLDMKEVAKNNFDGEYLILNMIDYHLDRKFDLIICFVDSINYLYEEELYSFFKCAHEHLNDNGRLIFDMHNISRLKEFKESYIEEGYVSDIPYLWTITTDEYEDIIHQHFTFYTNDGMIQEHHIQNVFSIELIKEKMKDFFNIRVIDDFVKDEKVLIIGEKK